MINRGFKTIYFNAWENDFEDNPLTALIGELKVINISEEEKFNRVVKNAALITKNVAPALFKAFINRYVDSEILIDALSDTSKSFVEIFEEDVKEYASRKKSIADFKKSLSEFVANESNGKPLVFVIDELDRCRPNYAVLLLEQIKHFFSVPNIVFVLSIHKVQLGHAIRGVYGSDKIDANEYLRRFIDIEYSIPEAERGKFFEHLYEYFEYDTFLAASERRRYREFDYDRENFIKTGKVLIGDLTLRQQEKILSHTRIALRTLKANNYLVPTVFIFLVYIKTIHEDFYSELSSKRLSLKDIQKRFYEIIEPVINEDNKRLFVQIEAFVLKFYENYKSEYRSHSEILEWNSEGSKYVLKINSSIDNDLLLQQLIGDRMAHDYADMKLSYFLNKLNLTENIKIN